MTRFRKTRVLAFAALAMAPASAIALEVADLQPLLDSLPPGMLKHGKPFNDEAGAVVFPDVVVTPPEGGQIRATAITIAALDVAAIQADTAPSELDITISGITLSASTFGSALDMPWPFDSDTIEGDIALRFAASFEGDPRIDTALDVDFGRHGVVNAAAVVFQPSWVDIPPDPADPFASMIPQSIEIHIDNVAVPELLFSMLTGEPDIWGHGPVPVALDFSYFMDEVQQDVSIASALDLGSGNVTLAMSGWPSARAMANPSRFYDGGPEMFFSELAWRRAKFSYADNGLAGALLDLLGVLEGETAFSMLAELLENLSEADSELGRDGPTRDIIDTFREMAFAYGTYDGDTLLITLNPVVPFTFADLEDADVDPDHGLHPDDMVRLLGLSMTYLPD